MVYKKRPFSEEDLLTASESDQVSCFTGSPALQEFTRILEAVTTIEKKLTRLEDGGSEKDSNQLELTTGTDKQKEKMPPVDSEEEEEIDPFGKGSMMSKTDQTTEKETAIEKSGELPRDYKYGRVSMGIYGPRPGTSQLTDTPIRASNKKPSKRLFSSDCKGESKDNQTGDEESDEESNTDGDICTREIRRDKRGSRERVSLPRGSDSGEESRGINKTGKLNRKYFMLQEATKNLKTKLKDDKNNNCYKFVNVRNTSCKELFKIFNSLNEEAYFSNDQVRAWHNELVNITETIQVRLAEKESLTFLEREQAKSEKKLAEDVLGKISISPIKDAIDFKVWAETVQNIKLQTAKL